MGAPGHLHGYTFAEYLDLESASNVRHEFLGGEIYAMAGGIPRHAALTLAVGSALLQQLRGGPHRVFGSDMRVRVRDTGLATYPDATVVAGELARDPDSESTVTNPIVVVEVLSPSTAAYDLGEKFRHYGRIESLQEVVYVAQAEVRIEVRRRRGDGSWSTNVYGEGNVAVLESIGCSLTVDEIYRDLPAV